MASLRAWRTSPLVLACFLCTALPALATSPLEAEVRTRTSALEQKLIGWRRDIHQHPELGDQEQRTSKLVASHLQKLGLEVHTGVARTGVVGILRGGKPGRTVALRADMDALPVTEPRGPALRLQGQGPLPRHRRST